MNSIQNKVKEFANKYHLQYSPEIIVLDLVSEIGEVAKEILESTSYGKKSYEFRKEIIIEIGDVFYSLINLANYFKINLEDALKLVIHKYEDRLKRK